MNFIKETWNKIPPVGKTVIVVGGGILVYKGVKKYINRPSKVDLPQGGKGLPQVGYDSSGNPVYWNAGYLSKELFDAMDGLFTSSVTKDKVWQKLADLPANDMVVAVYNHFNKNYGKGESLTKWIKDEYWTDFTNNGRSNALQRLEQLNLK